MPMGIVGGVYALVRSLRPSAKVSAERGAVAASGKPAESRQGH
jgi:hypothetical protein